MFFPDDRQSYRVSGLEGFSWLEYGFGTRHSPGWPGEWSLATLRQVHSATAVVVQGPADPSAEGDALITNTPGVLIGVRTADCLPILLVDERRRVVAAVHAGWRGTLAGVASSAVASMKDEYGTEPADIRAAMGPGIGSCCFEVGPEVAVRFQGLFPERGALDGRASVDLAEANRRLLLKAGIPGERIYCGAPCNCCRPAEFHSFRRDPSDAGRMLSVVGIRP